MSDKATPNGITKEQAEQTLRAALNAVSRNFLEGLKTDTEREALDTVENLNGMSDEEFSQLLAARMSVLDEQMRTEAAKVMARMIACWRGGDDEPLSLREEMLLELQSMIRCQNYKKQE
ncbi:MAG: hypothetical protein LUG26_07840 [Ruminococcus sp.]|nr:hypothetical protein [Ruminococcus sp.]